MLFNPNFPNFGRASALKNLYLFTNKLLPQRPGKKTGKTCN